MQIADGELFALFSFDVGFEVDLARARQSFPEGVRAGMGGTKIAPAHVQYASPPLVQPLGTRRLMVIERPVDAEVSVRLHDFGALSIVFDMPFNRVDADALPALTAALTARGALEVEARAVLDDVLPRIAAAIARPNDSVDLVEDYYVLQVSRFEPELDAAALLDGWRDLLARILHCEPARLSASETDDVLRTAVTYTPQDLVVTDWNVALVYDTEYQDVLNVLELLNVQLLELRYLDRHARYAHRPPVRARSSPAAAALADAGDVARARAHRAPPGYGDAARAHDQRAQADRRPLPDEDLRPHGRPPPPRGVAAQHRRQARGDPERSPTCSRTAPRRRARSSSS